MMHEGTPTQELDLSVQRAADASPQMGWLHDVSGELVLTSRAYRDYLGASIDELLGQRWQAYVHPEDVGAYAGELRACAREGRSFHARARLRRADGAWRLVESWGTPQARWFDDRMGLVGTSVDVTEGDLACVNGRSSAPAAERFEIMADAAPAMLWVTDAQDRCVFLSRRWYEFTGQTPQEGLGWGWSLAIHPEDRRHVVESFTSSTRRLTPYAADFRLRHWTGSYRWMSVAGNVWRSDAGAPLGYIGSISDIHERKLAENALREADRRKDEYLAMLGHELRNPLAAIRTATDLLALPRADDPRLRRIHAVLERQSGHMKRLIDGLVEVSRIARGKILLEHDTVDLRQIVVQVIQDRGADLSQSALDIVTDLPDEAVWVSGDHVRLVQMLDNLVGNAIKFSRRGGRITVSLTEDDGSALVRVIDTGVGIRPEFLERIFEPFLQDEQGVARTPGGLGLGLALVKGLVELHHGAIEARSAGPGRGAELRVRLPLAGPPCAAAASPEVAASTDSLRVLVVEDNADVGEMLREVLELEGHRVAIADNASSALDTLHGAGADVVLCDIGLPDMSGYELAALIRADASLCDLPLFAVSGYGQPEDRARSRAAGFDAHLVKPVDSRTLDEVLLHHPRIEHRLREGRHAAPGRSPSRVRPVA